MADNDIALEPCLPTPIENNELIEVVTKAKDWAIMHGAAMRSKENFSLDAVNFAPFVLFPSSLPRNEFERAIELQTLINRLMHSVAYDEEFLTTTLADTVKVDDFIRELFSIYKKVIVLDAPQPVTLAILRSDYMLETNPEPENRFDGGAGDNGPSTSRGGRAKPQTRGDSVAKGRGRGRGRGRGTVQVRDNAVARVRGGVHAQTRRGSQVQVSGGTPAKVQRGGVQIHEVGVTQGQDQVETSSKIKNTPSPAMRESRIPELCSAVRRASGLISPDFPSPQQLTKQRTYVIGIGKKETKKPLLRWKQIECNTIASGFGHLGPITRGIQRSEFQNH